jgi:hypothetical protein
MMFCIVYAALCSVLVRLHYHDIVVVFFVLGKTQRLHLRAREQGNSRRARIVKVLSVGSWSSMVSDVIHRRVSRVPLRVLVLLRLIVNCLIHGINFFIVWIVLAELVLRL